MPLKRITMAEVAKAANVHQTTVSLALRNDPRLPLETRTRIRAIADGMGYRPDPMLSALNFYRNSKDVARSQPTMAFIMRARANMPSEAFYPDDQLLRGARRAADRMGYRLVPFRMQKGPAEGARLNRIFKSRGVDGIIIAGLDVSIGELTMEWENFSSLCIESQHLRLSLHTVANNQSGITRMAVRRLHELGYRRIGLAVGEREETTLGKAFTAGYLIEVYEHRELRHVPPFLIHFDDDAVLAAKLGAWVRQHKIDVVISNWGTVPSLLKAAGLRMPQDVGVATLDHNPHLGPVAGIRQSHELVGERAVEALALLLKTNQRGLIRLPNTTLIDGVWQDGPDLPPKLKSRK